MKLQMKIVYEGTCDGIHTKWITKNNEIVIIFHYQ